MSFSGAYQYTPSNISGTNGAVFITDVEPQLPQDNVGGKQFSSGGRVLDSCVANTDLIRVHVLAITGNTNFQPSVLLEGISVQLTQDEDQSVWTGFVDLDKQGNTSISATHEDGPTHTCSVLTDSGPTILSAVFSGGYPGTQTELKQGDVVDLVVSSDTPMTRLEIADFGVADSQVFDFATTTSKTVAVVVANRGDFAQSFGLRVSAMNANGSFGAIYDTTQVGSVDALHTYMLNNLHPQISIGAIEYPVGQMALKGSENATINHTIADFDAVLYEAPGSEIQIASATSYSVSKVVTRIGGNYNVSANNFRIVATRFANGASSVSGAVVQIAHALPQISVQEPANRLQSGGNQGTTPKNHSITVTSDQLLFALPQIAAPGGNLLAAMVGSLNGTTFTQDLQVHDSDTKGVFAFQLLQATNLAGRIATAFTGDANYEIGGFVKRTIKVPRFFVEVPIGTSVVDANKLIAQDSANRLMIYAPDFVDGILKYTITGPTNTLNSTGDIFHWNDAQAANNNSTGETTVNIEEPP